MDDTEYWGLFLRDARTPLATKGTLSPVSFEFSTSGHGEVRTGVRNRNRKPLQRELLLGKEQRARQEP